MANWSILEVELVVADYLAMLSDELAAKPYNKTAHRRMLMPLLPNRTEKAIEYKYQNISAALIELGVIFIQGYRPLYNYQDLLKEECIRQLDERKANWENAFMTFSDTASAPPLTTEYSQLIDAPPDRSEEKPKKDHRRSGPFKINYLEREQRNLQSGVIGEQIALAYEKLRLIAIGRESLADKIEWVAEYDDGAGFDILSKNENGSDRYIEVKSTKLNKYTPIFFSNPEFEFASCNRNLYYLYRVFNIAKHPRLFTVNGDFDSFCQKEIVQFKGYF